MSSGKNKKGGRFEALVAAVEADGPLEATVLASSQSRSPASTEAQRAARLIVGTLANGPDRVCRVAALLDDLCAADAATGVTKRRHAS
jgi:hypothetical protein